MSNKKDDKVDKKKGTKRKSNDDSNVASQSKRGKTSAEGVEVSRRKDGTLDFPDHPRFRPNRTPKEVLQAGSFGGTYFRPIKSSVTGTSLSRMMSFPIVNVNEKEGKMFGRLKDVRMNVKSFLNEVQSHDVP